MAMVAVSHPPARQHPTIGAPCVSGYISPRKTLGKQVKNAGFFMAEPIGDNEFYVGLHRDATRIHMWIVSGNIKLFKT